MFFVIFHQGAQKCTQKMIFDEEVSSAKLMTMMRRCSGPGMSATLGSAERRQLPPPSHKSSSLSSFIVITTAQIVIVIIGKLRKMIVRMISPKIIVPSPPHGKKAKYIEYFQIGNTPPRVCQFNFSRRCMADISQIVGGSSGHIFLVWAARHSFPRPLTPWIMTNKTTDREKIDLTDYDKEHNL